MLRIDFGQNKSKEGGTLLKLVYPAIFDPYDDSDDGYAVEFPDLPGCVTGGDTMVEAFDMAVDAASGWVLTELEDGKQPPKASDPSQLKPEKGGFVSMVLLDMDSYAEKYGNKAVKKTLTIPAWMNTYVEQHNISCSKVLQDAVSKIVLG